MAASHFNALSEAVGVELVREELVNHYVSLLKDNEAEVRTAAAGQIPGFSKLLEPEVVIARIVPFVRDLCQDSSQHVRAALANQITGLAPLLGHGPTIDHLLQLFLHLLKDEFPDVRLNIISKLEQVNEVIGIQLLADHLLPAIVELAEDKSWRVRQAIIEYIPLLATQLGKDFFDEQLSSLCMSWLGDTVYSIREAATINLKKLTEVFGVEWARAQIVPKVVAMGSHPNYLYRMTTVQAIGTIAPSLNIDIVCDEVIDALLRLANDPIPNIRFNVARSLEVVATTYGGTAAGKDLAQQKIVPVLEELMGDQDADVRYFATLASQRTLGTIQG